VNVASAVIIALAGITVLGTSEPAPSAPEPPRVVSRAEPAVRSSSTPTFHSGPGAAEQVTMTMRPIPYPPAVQPPVARPADLVRSSTLVDAYRSAADAAPVACHLPVALLAAIGQIESGSAGGREIGADHRVDPPIYGPVLDGGPFASIPDTDSGLFDGDVTWDRAVGPMQFIPGTWRWSGVDGDGDGLADPQNVYDAAHSAAGYLCRAGRDLSQDRDLRAAIWAYNHSADYVEAVLEWLAWFTEHGLGAMGQVGFLVASGGRASELAAPGVSAAGAPPARTVTTGPTGGVVVAGPSMTIGPGGVIAPTTAGPTTGSPTTGGPTGGPPTSDTATPTPSEPLPTSTWSPPEPEPTTTTPEPTTTTPSPTTTTPGTPPSCDATDTPTSTTTTSPDPPTTTPDPTATTCDPATAGTETTTATTATSTTDDPGSSDAATTTGTSGASDPAPQQTATP
jgi:hypothetical protein